MKNILVALASVAVLSLAQGSALAQEKKIEPTKEELKKAEAAKTSEKKAEQAELKKEGKKKVKKGGC